MPVTEMTHDLDARTITLEADFDAPPQQVWEIYADPRQLERVWGPPDFPATFVHHDLTPGGRMEYYMSGPDGERYYGTWRVTEVDEPRSFSFEDAFANESFEPDVSMPVGAATVTLEPRDGGTHMRWVTTYSSAEDLQKVLDMGVVEGATQAVNQVDALLAGS